MGLLVKITEGLRRGSLFYPPTCYELKSIFYGRSIPAVGPMVGPSEIATAYGVI